MLKIILSAQHHKLKLQINNNRNHLNFYLKFTQAPFIKPICVRLQFFKATLNLASSSWILDLEYQSDLLLEFTKSKLLIGESLSE